MNDGRAAPRGSASGSATVRVAYENFLEPAALPFHAKPEK